MQDGHGDFQPITQAAIRAEVKRMIAEVIEVSPEEIHDTAHFREDLGIDSLLALEIMFSVDKKFRINIEESEYDKVTNVNETIAIVLRYMGSPAEAQAVGV